MRWVLGIPFFLICVAQATLNWPVSLLTIQIGSGPGQIIDLTAVAFAVFVHVGLVRLYPRHAYIAGLLVMILILVGNIFVGAILSDWIVEPVFRRLFPVAKSTEDIEFVTKFIAIVTYVPFSVASVVAIPFGKVEERLLRMRAGHGALRIRLLLIIRIAEHIVQTVIPRTVEYAREEGLLLFDRLANRRLFSPSIAIAFVAELICSSVEFIPFWASELAKLKGAKND